MRYLAVALPLLLGAGPATAMVLPEPVATMVEQRIDTFVSADGFTPFDADALLDALWFSPERFPNHPPEAMARPDADLNPITKAILLLESREPALPHTRYRITYGLQAASPDHPEIQHSYIEVTRFNLGPARHADVVASYGDDAAPAEVFGVGPDTAWRLVMTGLMGTRADPVAVSRKVLSASEADAADCLGAPCLTLAGAEGPAGDWFDFTPDSAGQPVVYADRSGELPNAARMADDLFALATADGEDPTDTDAPSLTLVLSSNVEGQDDTAFGLLLQDGVRDDSIAQIWTRHIAIGMEYSAWSQMTVGR